MSRHNAKARPAIQLSIAGISEGNHPFKFSVPVGDLQLDNFQGEAAVEGTLRHAGSQFVIDARITASYTGQCDRCLSESARELESPIRLCFSYNLADECGDDDLELRALHPDQTVITLDDDARQALLVDIPLKFLCSDDCKGLCPNCGTNLNTGTCKCAGTPPDPRWAKLSELFKPDDDN